jgi:hypothetical protein
MHNSGQRGQLVGPQANAAFPSRLDCSHLRAIKDLDSRSVLDGSNTACSYLFASTSLDLSLGILPRRTQPPFWAVIILPGIVVHYLLQRHNEKISQHTFQPAGCIPATKMLFATKMDHGFTGDATIWVTVERRSAVSVCSTLRLRPRTTQSSCWSPSNIPTRATTGYICSFSVGSWVLAPQTNHTSFTLPVVG